MKTVSKKGPHPLESFKQVVDVNVAGTFNVIRLAVDLMKDTEPLTESGERGMLIIQCNIFLQFRKYYYRQVTLYMYTCTLFNSIINHYYSTVTTRVEPLYNGHHWDQQPFNRGVLC